MTISSGKHAALGEHVRDCRDEDPPVVSPIAVVEDTVFQPGLLVLVKPRHIPLSSLQLSCHEPDPEDEEAEDACEEGQGHTGEDLCSP